MAIKFSLAWRLEAEGNGFIYLFGMRKKEEQSPTT